MAKVEDILDKSTAYGSLNKDLEGDDDDNYEDYGETSKGGRQKDDEKKTIYMMFDFRK